MWLNVMAWKVQKRDEKWRACFISKRLTNRKWKRHCKCDIPPKTLLHKKTEDEISPRKGKPLFAFVKETALITQTNIKMQLR